VGTHYTLFTQVHPFYENLLHTIESAQEQISMMYLTFEAGEWGEQLGKALCERAAAGVQVRLMVDDIGLIVDDPGNAFRNRWLMNHLRENGVQVDIFHPNGWHLSRWNRLHIKVCAIGGHTAFVGGSNIGDGYLRMSDHNLRLDGDLGTTFHDIYDYIRYHTPAGVGGPTPGFHPSHLFAGQAQVRLTVPGQRRDIRRALLDLILDAERAVYIRKWYFLPDREILEALCSQARNGVAVNILFSHRTPVLPINIANTLHAHELAKSGAHVYRFTDSYMHAKVAWNDQGQVLFGSANMDDKALRSNFECSLAIRDNALAGQLTLAFESDTKTSLLQTPSYFRRLPLRTKALSYAFSLAGHWL
jgi:cardiolipin synthase